MGGDTGRGSSHCELELRFSRRSREQFSTAHGAGAYTLAAGPLFDLGSSIGQCLFDVFAFVEHGHQLGRDDSFSHAVVLVDIERLDFLRGRFPQQASFLTTEELDGFVEARVVPSGFQTGERAVA